MFSEAPAALEVLKKALGELASNTASMPAREAAVSSAAALNRCTMSTQGHPVQRLASELFTLLREIAPTEGALEAGAVRTLNQAAELIGIMLLPAHLNQLKNLPEPKLLAIERDADLLGTMDAALQFSDIGTTGIGQPEEALALLDEKRFNAILLDVGASEQSALDFCDRIRALPGGAKTPLILLTLAGGSQPVTPGNLRGGNDVLEKPLNIVELSLKAHIWIFRDQLDLV